MICGLDTMALIWGLRDVGNTEPEMEKRALILLKQLDADEADVVISSITVAELLTPLDPKTQTGFLAELHKQFRIAPFDLSAAALAADLYRTSMATHDPRTRQGRKVVRADTLIVASLKMAGARSFYSHDRNCRNMVQRAGMVAHEWPTHSEKLFE
ncbi:MAG: hypothetical protein AMXMBFR13_47980 [Phycisphaerae bacterium]